MLYRNSLRKCLLQIDVVLVNLLDNAILEAFKLLP